MTSLDVLIITPEGVFFEGKATHVILPGEQGVFEVLPHHKYLISRLLAGRISVDNKSFPVKRGVVEVKNDKVTVVMER